MRRPKHVLLGVAVALCATLLAALSITFFAPIVNADGGGVVKPFCGLTWGSLDKQDDPMSQNYIFNARVGRQQCWDRFVVDMGYTNKPIAGYSVRYVDNVFTDGEGALVPLAGGAKLQVVVKAPAYDQSGNPTYPGVPGQRLPEISLLNFQTIKDAKFAGSFEGQTTFGLGVRAKLPFRVLKVSPNTVVVDVAHNW